MKRIVIIFISILSIMPIPWHRYEIYAQKSATATHKRVTSKSSQGSKSKETIEFEKEMAKAKKGDADAQCRIGQLYAEGKGVTKDLNKSMTWLQKAIDNGCGFACCVAAGVCKDNNDFSKRLEYLRRGITMNDEASYLCLHADYRLGINGTEKNENIVHQLIKYGCDHKIPASFHDRYLAHKYGIAGFEKNNQDAIFWLKRHIDHWYGIHLSTGKHYDYVEQNLKELKEFGCDYEPELHMDEFKAWMADKSVAVSSNPQVNESTSASNTNTESTGNWLLDWLLQ